MRLFTLLIFTFTFELSVSATEPEVISIGKKIILHSKIIGEDRSILIYVPENVKDNEPLYVIYLLDTEYHFHTVTGIVKSLTVLGRKMPKTMVVGIESTVRLRDFLPKINGEPQTEFQVWLSSKHPTYGQADKFLKFIKQELIPYIDENYSTYPHRTLIGHSNGGTLALYAMFNKPQLFNNYLAISPNGWWSHNETIDNANKLVGSQRPSEKLFISVAGEGGQFYTGTLDLLAQMEQNKPSNLNWQFKHYPELSHISGIFPAFSEGLEYLYKELDYKITPELAKYADVSAIKDYYAELSKKYGFDVPVPAATYRKFAEQQQNNQRNESALVTSKEFLAAYPKLYYAYSRVGLSYVALKKYKEAVASFEKAISVAKQEKARIERINELQDMLNNARTKL